MNGTAARYILPVIGSTFFLLGAFIVLYDTVIHGGKPDFPVIGIGVTCCILGVGCISPTTGRMIANMLIAVRKGEPIPEVQSPDPVDLDKIVQGHKEIIGATTCALSPDTWYTRLRPVLHQVVQYTSPTYYLDANYHIVDWNIAFDLVFSRITNVLRGKHVNWLIAQLLNTEEVFSHAKLFSAGSIPLVDLEPLYYMSGNYGNVRMLKIAVQLHDKKGEYRGWAVTLMIQEIPWDRFEKDLKERLNENKLWSVYAGSYDAVLTLMWLH